MLSTERCRNRFIEYVKDFDQTDTMISRKVSHTIRVADYSKEIAESLKLNKIDVDLAYIIGILHDIGRFRQVTECRNYSDKIGLGHAKIGDIILFEENMITEFVDSREYDNLIRQAVLNHSFFKINDDVTGDALTFAKIVRDADKLDIFNLFTFDDPIQMGEDSGYVNNDLVTKEVKDAFFNGKQITKDNLNTLMDWFINMIGFVFDLNYKRSFEILAEKEFLKQIFSIMKDIKKDNNELIGLLNDMEIYINNYIGEKVNKDTLV